MSTAPAVTDFEPIAGEPTLFDSLARLVPEELQAAYYRVLAHTRKLSPDDEMLRILEAMGVLTLLTRHTPKDIADERERFKELLEVHDRISDDTRQQTIAYVRELDMRISKLPKEVEAGLDPNRVAQLLGESLRQQFLLSGISDTVKGLQTTGAAMTSAQKDLSAALRNLSDSRGVVAQIETANNRLTHSLECRAKAVDKLLGDLKSDVLHIWIPLISGAALLLGMFLGMCIQGHLDSNADAVTAPAAIPAQTNSSQGDDGGTAAPRNQKHRDKDKTPSSNGHHER